LEMIKPSHVRKVVVLSPPAHEPGEPPITISPIIINRDMFVKLEISTELNPAVRQVTDWNRAAILLISVPCVGWSLRLSMKNRATPPATIRNREVSRTIVYAS